MNHASFLPKVLCKDFNPNYEYDVNVIVLVHFNSKYKNRLEFFKKYGLINFAKLAIHVTLICSPGDKASCDEILDGWPSKLNITLLEGTGHDPLPKANGFYVWLASSGLCARWHLRVDDDSCSDIASIITYADLNYGNVPIHLMTPPIHHDSHMHSVMHELEFNIAPIHEHECALTSKGAFEALYGNSKAMEFLHYTGERYHAPSDLCLAWALHISGVPALTSPVFTKDFYKTEMSIIGGTYMHIHYIDWQDKNFTDMLESLLFGEIRIPNLNDVQRFLGKPLVFGRCVGEPICELVLHENGEIIGNTDKNESYWRLLNDYLVFYSSEGMAKTIFHRCLNFKHQKLLLGRFTDYFAIHYLRLL